MERCDGTASTARRGRPVVTLANVSVRYGPRLALQDVSAALPPGAVGLLGPNGAGKSTLIKALLGFIAPDRGEMRVLGLDVRHAPLEIRAARRLHARDAMRTFPA